MRAFQKILQELRLVVSEHLPGDSLQPPASMPKLIINGRTLHYAAAGLDREERAGASPNPCPVILLHGFGGFFMDWPRVMAPLARHTRVYALDLPGWGFSEPNPSAASLEDEVKVIEQFIKQLGLNRVILCGLSYGAGVAWAAAAMNLPRVSRVVLLNPMPPHPLKYMHSPLYRAIFFANSVPAIGRFGHVLMNKAQYKLICRENLLNERLLDTFYLDLAYMVIKQPKMATQLAMHASGAKTIDWNEWEHRLAGVHTPVSILQGQEDRIFSLKSATYLHRLIPTSELIEIPQCGHAMVFDQHRRVAEFVIRHLHPKEEHESTQETLRTGP